MAKPETKELATSSSKSPFGSAYDLGSRYLAEFGEVITGYRAGQFLFRKTDDVLRTVEKSVQWSVQPQINPSPLEDADSADKKGNECLMTNGSKKKSYPGELIRPLPWVFFIPLLLLIRAVRKGAELQAWLLDREVTTPKHMVRYIQGMRRRLRAVKYRGMRNARAGVATPRGDADKSYANTTLSSSPSSPSISKSKQPSDGSDLGSDLLSKTSKRKLSDREAEESSSDDDGADADALDAEEASDRPGSSLGRLLETADLSESDNDPDFQPDSSLDANSSDSDDPGSDASDDEPPHSVEVKRLSQPTSLINADIIEEEVEDSVDSSTISISEIEDHDVGSRSERGSKDEIFYSVSSCREEQGVKGVVGSGVDGLESGPGDEVASDYESCTVSLSAKSVDIASSIEISDRSDSSAMQRMSSLFTIKNRKKSEVK